MDRMGVGFRAMSRGDLDLTRIVALWVGTAGSVKPIFNADRILAEAPITDSMHTMPSLLSTEIPGLIIAAAADSK
jgi:hypothetical protein